MLVINPEHVMLGLQESALDPSFVVLNSIDTLWCIGMVLLAYLPEVALGRSQGSMQARARQCAQQEIIALTLFYSLLEIQVSNCDLNIQATSLNLIGIWHRIRFR